MVILLIYLIRYQEKGNYYRSNYERYKRINSCRNPQTVLGFVLNLFSNLKIQTSSILVNLYKIRSSILLSQNVGSITTPISNIIALRRWQQELQLSPLRGYQLSACSVPCL